MSERPVTLKVIDFRKHCLICGTPVNEWPMCFRGDLTCSVNCDKAHKATIKPRRRAVKKK